MEHKSIEDSEYSTSIIQRGEVSRVIEGGIWVLISRIYLYAISILASSLAARIYGPEGYALLIQTVFILDFLGAISSLSLNAALLRQVAVMYGRGEYRRTLATFTAALIISVVSSLLAVLVFIFFSNDILSYLLRGRSLPYNILYAVLMVPVFASMSLMLEYLRGLQDFKYPTLISAVPVGRIAIIAAVLTGTHYLITIPFFAIAAFLLIAVFLLYRLKHYYRISPLNPVPSLDSIVSEITPLVSFAIPMYISSLVNFFSISINNIIVPSLAPLEVLSAVTIAVSISGMINNLLNVTYSTVLFPYFSKIYGSYGRRGIRYITFRVSKLSFIFYTAGLLLLSPFAKEIITLYAGEKYLIASPYLTYLFLASSVYVPIFSLWVQGENASGRPILPSINVVVGTAIYMFSLALLVPVYGIYGFIISHILSTSPFWVIYMLAGKKITPLEWVTLLKTLGILLPQTMFMFLLQAYNTYIAFLVLPLLVVLYLNLVFRLEVINSEEYETIKNILPGPLKNLLRIVDIAIIYK